MNFSESSTHNAGTRVKSFPMKAFLALLSAIPFPLLASLLRGLARLAYRIGLRRRVVTANLRAALGDNVSDKEREKIARGCYVEFGQTIAEVLKPGYLIKHGRELFRVSGIEHLDGELKKEKGLVILTAHVSNYLSPGYLFKNLGYRIHVVSKHMANEAVDRVFTRFYEKHGPRLIKITGHKNDPAGGFKILRTLKRGEVVVILNDQDAGTQGYRSTFFGLPTFIPSGPASFIFKSKGSVITSFASRENGKIVISFQPPIDYSAARTVEDAGRIIFDEYSRRLEEKVRENPEQYFWLHKKWKSLPEIKAQYSGN